MTPILNCVLGVETPWNDAWHEEEPHVTLLDASTGECGLVYDSERDVCYFGLRLYSGEPHELEETISYQAFQSITDVKVFLSKHHVNGNIRLYFFTTFV